MHRLAISLILLTVPFAASAQTAPPPGQRPITRDQFVQRAAEMAGRRFDEIDTSHAGVITRDQIRAWRQAHGAPAGAQPAPVE